MFITRSAWQLIRTKFSKVHWCHWIWHKLLPSNISLVMWRSIYHCLPARISHLGIPVVSKYNCCHVLNSSMIATQVWNFFLMLLGCPLWPIVLSGWGIFSWWHIGKNSSRVGILIGLLPFILGSLVYSMMLSVPVLPSPPALVNTQSVIVTDNGDGCGKLSKLKEKITKWCHFLFF